MKKGTYPEEAVMERSKLSQFLLVFGYYWFLVGLIGDAINIALIALGKTATPASPGMAMTNIAMHVFGFALFRHWRKVAEAEDAEDRKNDRDL
jgi:hypothetical protein